MVPIFLKRYSITLKIYQTLNFGSSFKNCLNLWIYFYFVKFFRKLGNNVECLRLWFESHSVPMMPYIVWQESYGCLPRDCVLWARQVTVTAACIVHIILGWGVRSGVNGKELFWNWWKPFRSVPINSWDQESYGAAALVTVCTERNFHINI